jgi:hypothetical protein
LPKPPSKNGHRSLEKKLLQKRSLFGLYFGFFGWNDDGGGDFVLGFEVEQPDALGGAAGGADGFGVDADDLAGYLSFFRTSFVPIRKVNPKTMAFCGCEGLPVRMHQSQGCYHCRAFRPTTKPTT